MATNSNMKSYSSLSHLIKSSSDTPTTISTRSNSKKMKTSKSSVSMMKRSNMTAANSEVSVYADQADKVEKSKPPVPRECECGPDLYSRVLGPTADETILTGLQTVIDLCNKLRVCGDKDENQHDEEPEREQDVPERDVPSVQSQPSQAKPLRSESRSQTDRNMVSAGFQVNPSLKTVAAQTSGFPEMVSEILSTAGLSPEMVSQIMQTSFTEIAEPKQASLRSIFLQTSGASLYSNAMQTSNPEVVSGMVQTSSGLLPTITEVKEVVPPPPPSSTTMTQSDRLPTISRQTMVDEKQSVSKQTMADEKPSVSKQTMSDQIKSLSKQTMADNGSLKSVRMEPDYTKVRSFSQSQEPENVDDDEHKNLSPPEPPESRTKTCRCCKCSSSTILKKNESKESRISDDGKRPCVCGSKRKSKCKCEPKPSKSSVAGDQQPPLEVKYAVARISKFKEFTTFEVMKSTKNKPRHIPKGIEGVFVLKKKREDSKSDVKRRHGGSVSRSSTNGEKNNGSNERHSMSESRSRGSRGEAMDDARSGSRVESAH